jgi:hypothetical protein
LPLRDSIAFSLVSGALGGVAGNPADLVNVRMQNDKKLPVAQQRKYANVFDGLLRIARTDGVACLWNGWAPNVARAMLMTSGQLASYDLFKQTLVTHCAFDDRRMSTHLTASCLAGVVATVITQPVDVVKTRMMNQACAARRSHAAASITGGGSAPTLAHTSTAPMGTLAVVLPCPRTPRTAHRRDIHLLGAAEDMGCRRTLSESAITAQSPLRLFLHFLPLLLLPPLPLSAHIFICARVSRTHLSLSLPLSLFH